MALNILPPAKTTFIDGNGTPLAGGSVFMYVPNTSTFKMTWQDVGGTIANTNPIILDGNGEALIFGSGEYRQVVQDSLGNTLWDAITLDPGFAIVASFHGTSTTAVNIGTGTKSFTTQPGLQFFPGGTLVIASNASALNYMIGTVTSYDITSGALVMNILQTGGSGTYSDWNISITGQQGPAGTVTSISVATTNGLAGTSSGGGTPQLTLSTTVTGVVKGNGTALSAATPSIDYIAPNTGTGLVNEAMLNFSNNTTANVTTSAHGLCPILPNNIALFLNGQGTYSAPVVSSLVGTSTTSNTIGTGTITFTTQAGLTLGVGQFVIIPEASNSANFFFGAVTSYSGTTLVINSTVTGGSGTYSDWNIFISGPQGPAGTGTVSSVSVVSANGLAGTVATPTSTPAITLSTSVTGILKGNGTAISAATPGTDYLTVLSGDVTTSGNVSTVGKVNGVSYGTTPSTNTVPVVTGSNTITYETVPVAAGGTGDSSFTAYTVICGGTTTTGNLQNVTSVGTSGQVLTSNGPSALPTFQTVAGLPAAVTGTLSGSATTFTVDFTTYSTYEIYITNLTTSGTGTGTIQVSSNGGSSYASENSSQSKFVPASSIITTSDYSGANAGTPINISGSISQPSTSSVSSMCFQGGEDGGGVNFFTNTLHSTSAAINTIKITNSSTFTGGSVILQPISHR